MATVEEGRTICLYRTLTYILPCLILTPGQSSQRSCLDIFHHKYQYCILCLLVVYVPGLFKSLKLHSNFRKAASYYRWKCQSLPYYQSGQWYTAGEVSRWSASYGETVVAGGQQNPCCRYLVSNFEQLAVAIWEKLFAICISFCYPNPHQHPQMVLPSWDSARKLMPVLVAPTLETHH